MNHLHHELLAFLKHNQNAKKSDWWNAYMKGVIPFYGVGIPIIREELKRLNKDHPFHDYSKNEQIDFLTRCIKGEYTEEKLIAILYLQLFWVKHIESKMILSLIEDWFDSLYLFDWNTVDWLCVRVIQPLVDLDPENTIPVLESWNSDVYLWKARASLVPFAQCKTISDHKETIFTYSSALIQREERFSKTAVGWVLRELAHHHPKDVKRFIQDYREHFTSEVFKNATKHMNID